MPHPPTTIDARFEVLLRRLDSSGVASQADLVGCSDQEIARVEAKYRVTLPTSYRLFLRTMGHKSGRLFTHDHVRASYADVIGMTEERGASGALPESDVLVILSRLREQWLFIRCSGGNDAPVMYYGEGDVKPRESHASVLDWLETWCEEAEEAIRDGYYESFPEGTR